MHAPRWHAEPDIAEMIREYLRREDQWGNEEVLSWNSFALNIWFVRNPSDFKLPRMRSYNEKYEPMVHLLKYKQHMEVVGATEEILFKFFPIYLIGIATLWFCRLKPWFISSYSNLVQKFKSQFRVYITRPMEAIIFTDIKQRDGESLWIYLTRFNYASLAMKMTDESLIHMIAVSDVNRRTDFS